MLNLKENRDRLIRQAIKSIKVTSLNEGVHIDDFEDFEYEPSEIIKILFEAEVESVNFKERQSRPSSRSQKSYKKKKLEEVTFFSNSKSYIKHKKDTNETTK